MPDHQTDSGKNMQLSMPGGVSLAMIWPETIPTDDLQLIEQILAIQLRSVRKTLERRKNENQIPLPLEGAMRGAEND